MLLLAGRSNNFEPRVKSAVRGSSPVVTMSRRVTKSKASIQDCQSQVLPDLWFSGGLKYCGKHYNQSQPYKITDGSCDIPFPCGRSLTCQHLHLETGVTRNRTTRNSSMSCTPSLYPPAHQICWPTAASLIITIAPLIRRNHLHIVVARWQHFLESQHVGCPKIRPVFLMQGCIEPAPSNEWALENTSPVRWSNHSRVGLLVMLRRPKLLQASVTFWCLR